MGERNDLLVPLITCNKILFRTIITTMFCLLKRVNPQPEIHNSGKGTVVANQARWVISIKKEILPSTGVIRSGIDVGL